MAEALAILGTIQNNGGMMLVIVLLWVDLRYARRDISRIFKHLGWE